MLPGRIWHECNGVYGEEWLKILICLPLLPLKYRVLLATSVTSLPTIWGKSTAELSMEGKKSLNKVMTTVHAIDDIVQGALNAKELLDKAKETKDKKDKKDSKDKKKG